VLHRDIKYVTVEDPGLLPVKIKEQFVNQLKGANVEFNEFPHQFIMVPGNVNYFGIFCHHTCKVSDYHQVRLWKEPFAKLPDIDDVAVQDQHFGFDASQVLQQFPGVTTECTQMNIGNNDQVDFAFRE